MRAAIYARVSTTDKGQNVDMQLNSLRPYCDNRGWTYTEYVDNGVSGSKEERNALTQLLKDAKQRKFDVIVVWKLDRFSRSLKHLVTTLDDMRKLGVDFVSFSENIDFTTPSGRLMVNLLAAFAEFEKDIMRERIKAGMTEAKSKGKHVGRKPKAPIDIHKVIKLFEEATEKGKKISIREISDMTKMGKSTVHSIIRDYKKGLLDKDGYSYDRPLVEFEAKQQSNTQAE
jgi:DNA invertase Pin-like site-specific DNA recombinase